MRTVLLDGDVLAFIIACRAQVNVDWDGDGNKHSFGDAEAARHATTSYLRRLQSDLKADRTLVCMSDSSRHYFRHTIFPQYKAHRSHGTPPVILPAVKDFLRKGSEEFPSKTVETLEADDVLGILATHPTIIKGEKIVVSSDKDLKQIPGEHFDPTKNKHFDVAADEARNYFYHQTLTGDRCDGFPGCPGIGPKKANALLSKASLSSDSTWSFIVKAYAAKGLTEADALTQARVARILQYTDYDFKERKVKLWNPN